MNNKENSQLYSAISRIPFSVLGLSLAVACVGILLKDRGETTLICSGLLAAAFLVMFILRLASDRAVISEQIRQNIGECLKALSLSVLSAAAYLWPAAGGYTIEKQGETLAAGTNKPEMITIILIVMIFSGILWAMAAVLSFRRILATPIRTGGLLFLFPTALGALAEKNALGILAVIQEPGQAVRLTVWVISAAAVTLVIIGAVRVLMIVLAAPQK